ncbi:hypothetical protein [Risungbinella massiliensis]|uniref:hypothetical protein n=1 Tax=Risungbinella massiliensis TaxID=1329796 RepID=UPI0005CBD6C9|nr:hypothetical protein [Risungbinella massiliensis]
MNTYPLQIADQTEVVVSTGMITPAGSIEQTIEQFQIYQELKERIGSPEDFQKIGDKHHPKKSFVRKVQRFFNVSCAIMQDERYEMEMEPSSLGSRKLERFIWEQELIKMEMELALLKKRRRKIQEKRSN